MQQSSMIDNGYADIEILAQRSVRAEMVDRGIKAAGSEATAAWVRRARSVRRSRNGVRDYLVKKWRSHFLTCWYEILNYFITQRPDYLI
jgi:hypothetical protein